MKVIDLPLSQLREASWNANVMTPAMASKLRESISRFGLVENLIIRPLEQGVYEVLSGNQRLRALRDLSYSQAPCVIVEQDDVQARLLAQAVNRVQGEDDLGLKAELIGHILETIPQAEVLALLPETANSLQALASLGQQDLAQHIHAWQTAQAARLKHLQFQLTSAQLEVVEKALSKAMSLAQKEQGESPNVRGTALFILCQEYLGSKEDIQS